MARLIPLTLQDVEGRWHVGAFSPNKLWLAMASYGLLGPQAKARAYKFGKDYADLAARYPGRTLHQPPLPVL